MLILFKGLVTNFINFQSYSFTGRKLRGNQFFEVSLTVHLSITLVNEQRDAQFFHFIIRLLQSSTCFEQSRAYHQEVKFY